MPTENVKKTVARAQEKWWEKQGLPSPVVRVEDFDAGKGKVPDIKGEFGYFPTSILILSRSKELYEYLADNKRPVRTKGSVYHSQFGFSIFPPAASWFCVKYWSKPGQTILDPFGNRANIGLIANWLGRRVILNDIVPNYCELMRTAGKRRHKKNLSWRVLNQDAASLKGVKDGSVDLVLTGPPYFNLEKYEKVSGQASDFRKYEDFLEWYGKVGATLLRVVSPNGFCALKVGNWRKSGRIVHFVRDTLRTFEAAGWTLHDELICVEQAPQALAFSWATKWRNRVVHKSHQTVMVFRKSA